MATTQKITPNLWFNSVGEEAVNYYTSIFKNSKIGRKTYYTAEGQEYHKKEPGTLMTVEFWIEGQEFVILNGGPEFKFNESISFIVNCNDQEEVDYYWDKLSQGGDPNAQICGWLKDKYGVSWQIVPTILVDLMTDKDTERAKKVTQAMFQMKKLDIAALKKAANG
jgi:predicted 3-demethylubiquinone-9 3-methyltransferase (glyoxalase superfamily)